MISDALLPMMRVDIHCPPPHQQHMYIWRRSVEDTEQLVPSLRTRTQCRNEQSVYKHCVCAVVCAVSASHHGSLHLSAAPVRAVRAVGAAMAAQHHGDEVLHSSETGLSPEHGGNIPKRHARVTVKYNRRELQRRLDVEKWIDESLDQLYAGQVGAGKAAQGHIPRAYPAL